MLHSCVDDNAKRRLTERVDILTAIRLLRARGISFDALPEEITRIFYVDLDELNAALGAG